MAKLIDAVLDYLTSAGGAEAISYLHRSLREEGWRGLGSLADFEDTLHSLGFTTRQGRNDRGQKRTEVTL